MSDEMRSHEELRIDLAAYALGSLDPASRAALEAHLEGCAECRALLAEYEQVVDGLPFSLPVQQPPDGALDRLLERARGEPVEDGALPLVPDHRTRYLWAGFAALAALLLVMLGWNIWLQFNSDDGYSLDADTIALVVPMAGSEEAPAASGHLVMDKSWEDGALVASGLPVLGDERDYQLWFVLADGSRESGAVFHPGESGEITVRVDIPDNWRDLTGVGVTEEPAGGSPGPTGRNVLRGQISDGP